MMEEKRLKKHRTVRQALKYVAQNPHVEEDTDFLQMPVWELISRSLFDIANTPDRSSVRGVKRSTVARELVFNWLGGTRRAGTHPAVKKQQDTLVILDLTKKELS